MEGGRADGSGPRHTRRWPRRIAWIGGGALALVVLLVAFAPLLLRGRVVRAVVARATARLCGELRVEDARFGWTLVPGLLRGRSFPLEIENARVRAPDGTEVLFASRVRANVMVSLRPLSVVVEDAVATDGRWSLTVGGRPGGGFLDAFRTVAAGGDRGTCLQPRPRSRHAPRPPTTGPTGSLVVRDVRLEEIDVALDFPPWGLSLPRVRAEGSLSVVLPSTGGLLFEARNAVAPKAVLRIGRVGASGTIHTSFDAVTITRVAAAEDRPTDIALTLGHARTGRSDLTGTARFENVFRKPGGPRPPPGMTLDAHWSDMGDALSRLEAEWLPDDATLGTIGIAGTLAARLAGPYTALTGSVSMRGPRTQVEATIQDGRQGAADLRLDRVDLAPLLPERARALVGGVATGRLHAHADLAPRLVDAEATIDVVDLSIARPTGQPGPRRLSLHVGPGAGRAAPPSTADTLFVELARARLHDGRLALDGARARWGGVAVDAALAVTLPPPTGAAARRTPVVDATIAVAVTSLARWFPPAKVDAHGAARARITGPLDELRARVAFSRETRAMLFRMAFRLPREVTAAIDGETLTLPNVRLEHEAGGALTARLRVTRGGPLSGHFEVQRFPIAQVPGVAEIDPGKLAQVPTLAALLGGAVDVSLDLRGTVADPVGVGTVEFDGVLLAGRRLGDGRFHVVARPQRLQLDGTIGEHLSANGFATWRRGGPEAKANVHLQDYPLGLWLPPELGNLGFAVTGDVVTSAAPGRPTRGAGKVRLAGKAGAVVVDGSIEAGRFDGTAVGHVELEPLRPVWSRCCTRLEGALDLDVAGQVDFLHPAPDLLRGKVSVTREIVAQPLGRPLTVVLAEGGRLELDGDRLRTPGLTVTTRGATATLRGEARIEETALERSALALTASGNVDAAVFAREAHIPQLASASGRVSFDARVEGEVHAPQVAGQARLDDLELRLSAAGWPPLRVDGTVEAKGQVLSTRGLKIETGSTGSLVIGRADAPASVEIAMNSPPRLGRVDVPVAAHGLHFGDARTAFEIRSLDLAVRLAGDPRSALRLVGEIGIAGARFDPRRGAKKPSTGPSRPWYEALPPRFDLDLALHGPKNAVTVDVPVLPDVSVGFDCRVSANAHGAAMSGQIRGSSVYSRMAIALYDWFKPQDVRACRVLK